MSYKEFLEARNLLLCNEKSKTKEDINMEEKLNSFLTENSIEVDQNGNFKMYIVVDVDNNDYEIGSIFHGTDMFVYTESEAYEDLKENEDKDIFGISPWLSCVITPKISKQKTIKEKLLTMEDKMFKILVNKKNVIEVKNNSLAVNKYKIIEAIELNPVLKFKIEYINDDLISIIFYNSITEKSRSVKIKHYGDLDTFEGIENIKRIINNYLEEDERRVNLINLTLEDGVKV